MSPSPIFTNVHAFESSKHIPLNMMSNTLRDDYKLKRHILSKLEGDKKYENSIKTKYKNVSLSNGKSSKLSSGKRMLNQNANNSNTQFAKNTKKSESKKKSEVSSSHSFNRKFDSPYPDTLYEPNKKLSDFSLPKKVKNLQRISKTNETFDQNLLRSNTSSNRHVNTKIRTSDNSYHISSIKNDFIFKTIYRIKNEDESTERTEIMSHSDFKNFKYKNDDVPNFKKHKTKVPSNGKISDSAGDNPQISLQNYERV